MAKLKNLEKIPYLKVGEKVCIGHNRFIEVANESPRVYLGRLHGHAIFEVRLSKYGEAFIRLDTQGFLTRTTMSAMQDFAKAFGVQLSCSMAKGEFSIRYRKEGEYEERTQARDNRVFTFWAERYPL